MIHPRLKHISNSGEMGRLIASHDWTATSLGDPDSWSQSLIAALEIMVENKFPMYLLWGKDLLQFYNDPYLPFLGNKHPLSLGNKPSDTFPEIYEKIEPIFKEVLSGKAVYHQDMAFTILINNIPEERFFTFTSVPLRLENGNIGGIFYTLTETTEEIRAKKALVESEKSFRNYQEYSPIPFFSITENWIVNYINPAALRGEFLKKEEIIGKVIFDIWEIKDTIIHENYKLAMKGQAKEFEIHYEPYKSWYRIFAYPLSPGVGVIFEDITESKALQDRLKAAVEARDLFLSIASHELNTPLTSLKLHTQMMQRMLKKGFKKEKLVKFIEMTGLHVSRLVRIVEDMLDLSRIREGSISFVITNVDLKGLLSDSLERFALYYQEAGLAPPDLSFDGRDFFCCVDVNRFEQIVSNLLTNALKYGEGKPVHVHLSDEGDHVALFVQDQGKGISKEDQEHLFEQFYRGRRPTGEGLGLGLFITKKIVAGHAGDISVKSEIGKGTTFKVVLPKKGMVSR